MEVTVRYFAQAREAAGREEERVELAASATLEALWQSLEARYPALAPLARGVSFAVGTAPTSREDTLSPGDVVSVLPPVSGG